MNRYYSLEYNTDAIPSNDTIHCHTYWCRTQVASFNEYIPMSQSGVLGIFNRVFNVHVPDNMSYRLSESGPIVANTYCRQCGKMIGWKFITAQKPDMYVREGKFCMRLDKLTFSNHIPLLRSIEEQNFQANEGNADQDGDSTDQDGDTTDQDATDQDGDPADQDLATNEQNADQDGDANEQVPKEKEVGATEQNVNQDGGANEQNADQHGGDNQQNHDQDGGAPMN
ncbi:hypothetical protein KY290_033266 [Solanum tuberosum]|uniref:Yippee domain-containing protein n=1 Tax=Solanum tuberosum TaxID=4113 RepID=A0ABQ7U1L3_SOLTU|nr:hypothetical protein KY289_032636 [Solanum tuberosum]KAH0647278.1 hypothetical protein KY285_032526 [Solanum tuberosum]KAH0740223.1 hypothetical protein KY290_033266 [Solanum tuberosum]